MRIGVVGCGVISDIYLNNLIHRYANTEVVCCTNRSPEKAAQKAQTYGIEAVSYEELMTRSDVDVVLNLTPPAQHVQVDLDAIRHGKHVYSEKPLALSLEEGQLVLESAKKMGVQVGCAPDIFLGGTVQTMYRAIADGRIGDPVAVTAGWSSRGHERWHTNPAFYYQEGAGPVLDMGPYYITALVGAFGSVKRVCGMSKRTFPKRTITAPGDTYGQELDVQVDTHCNAILEFENGVTATLLLSFDLWSNSIPRMEIYGTTGTLLGPDPNTQEGGVHIRGMNETAMREVSVTSAFTGNVRGLGLSQMCDAIEHGGQICASGELALHVLDVMLSIEEACRKGETVACRTRVEIPPVFEIQ